MPWPYDDEEQEQYQAQFQRAKAPMGAQGPPMGSMPMPAPGSMRQKLASMAPPPDQGGGGMGAAIQGVSGAASKMIGKAGQAQAQGRARQEIGAMTDAGRRGPLQTQDTPQGMGMEGLIPRARGGYVDDDDAYMVGEQGPETFVPEQPGYIVPNPKTVQGPQAPEGNAGPGYNPPMGAMPQPQPGAMREKLKPWSNVKPEDTDMGAAISGITKAATGVLEGGDDEDGDDDKHRAYGGYVDPSDAYTVGEQGPEAFVPQSGSGYIMPHRAPAAASSGMGQQGRPAPTPTPSPFDFRGGEAPPPPPQPTPTPQPTPKRPNSMKELIQSDINAVRSLGRPAPTPPPGPMPTPTPPQQQQYAPARSVGGGMVPPASRQSGNIRSSFNPPRAPKLGDIPEGAIIPGRAAQASPPTNAPAAAPSPSPAPEPTGDARFDAYLRGGGAQAAPSPGIQKAAGVLDRANNWLRTGNTQGIPVGDPRRPAGSATPTASPSPTPGPSPSPTPGGGPASNPAYAGTPYYQRTPSGDWVQVGGQGSPGAAAPTAGTVTPPHRRRAPAPAGAGAPAATPAPAAAAPDHSQDILGRQPRPGDPTPVPENTDYGFGSPAQSQGTQGPALTPQQAAEQNMQSRARMIGTKGIAPEPGSMNQGDSDLIPPFGYGGSSRQRVETEAGRQGQRAWWKRAGMSALQGALAGAAGGGGLAGAIGGAATGGIAGGVSRQAAMNIGSNVVDIPSQNVRDARAQHQTLQDQQNAQAAANLEHTQAQTGQARAATTYEQGRGAREDAREQERIREWNASHKEDTRQFDVSSGISAKESEARVKNMSFQQQLEARKEGLTEAEARQKYGQMTKQQVDEEDRDSKYFADSLFGAPEAINIRGQYQNDIYNSGPGKAAEKALQEETAKGPTANQYAIQGYNQQIIAAKKDAMEEAKARYEVETGGYWTEQARKLRRDNHGVMPNLSGQKANYDQIDHLRQKYNFRTWDDAARVFRRLGVEVDDRKPTGTTAQP